jgi:hypothetical protein
VSRAALHQGGAAGPAQHGEEVRHVPPYREIGTGGGVLTGGRTPTSGGRCGH